MLTLYFQDRPGIAAYLQSGRRSNEIDDCEDWASQEWERVRPRTPPKKEASLLVDDEG